MTRVVNIVGSEKSGEVVNDLARSDEDGYMTDFLSLFFLPSFFNLPSEARIDSTSIKNIYTFDNHTQ